MELDPDCPLQGSHLNDDENWCVDFEETDDCSTEDAEAMRGWAERGRDAVNARSFCGEYRGRLEVIREFDVEICQWIDGAIDITEEEHAEYCANI